ncbi:DUF2089 domain-containing protein [Candidatus Pacearchaeota archaeon]|jgi:hypothetical protein|nr:DUF2089 domain-containing protein [Candidatus Pacearchaeota archaeon]
MDTKGLPVIVDLQTSIKAEVLNRHRESILAIEGELGIKPSGTYTTVRARLDEMEYRLCFLSCIEMSNVIVGTGSASEIRQLTEDDILPGFAIISFTIAGTNYASVVEVGTSISSIVASVAENYVPTSGTITDNAGGTWTFATPFSSGSRAGAAVVKTVNNQTYTATLSVTKGTKTQTATQTVSWQPYVYHGNSVIPGSYNSSFVTSLTNRALQPSKAAIITDTMGVDEYEFYCLPNSYGTPTFQYGVLPGGWSLVAQTSVTNSQGVTQLYDIWMTNQPNLSTITWTVT